MHPDPEALGVEEYRALRATIRERGTARLFVMAITFVAWAALALAAATLFASPAFMLIPFVVLVAGFEISYSAYAGTERVGRFVAARYEDAEGRTPGWEHSVAHSAPRVGGSGPLGPLAAPLFITAALLNLIPMAVLAQGGPLIAGVPAELAVYGALHGLWMARAALAGRYISALRARDTALFTDSNRSDPSNWSSPSGRS